MCAVLIVLVCVGDVNCADSMWATSIKRMHSRWVKGLVYPGSTLAARTCLALLRSNNCFVHPRKIIRLITAPILRTTSSTDPHSSQQSRLRIVALCTLDLKLQPGQHRKKSSGRPILRALVLVLLQQCSCCTLWHFKCRRRSWGLALAWRAGQFALEECVAKNGLPDMG